MDVTCLGGGASCDTGSLIQIMVDNETCYPVEFDGYVQACCQDISSLDGRVPFSTTFVPSPSCKKYLVTCVVTPVGSISVPNPGSGYTVGTNPSVGFSGGGGGSGATATAYVGTGPLPVGVFTAFIGGGSGYVPGTYGNIDIDGGSGTGARGQFVVSGSGVITSGFIYGAPGAGYLSTDVLRPRASEMGGNTSDATFSLATDYGTITRIVLNTPGVGYTVAPNVTIAPPPSGGVATAVAVMGTCPGFTTTNCDGSTATIPAGLAFGQAIDFCSVTGGPNVSSQFTVVPDGNCACDCELVTVAASGTEGFVYINYTSCAGTFQSVRISPGASPSSFTDCMVSGSVVIHSTGLATGTVTINGAC